MPIVHTKINMRVHLECLVESAPAATVQWFHHGIPIVSDSNIDIHSKAKHILIIKKVQDSDLGFYECRAENKVGFKGAQIELTGRPLPCAFKVNPGLQKPTSHMLIWQTESLSPISEYKLKFRQIPSGSGRSTQSTRSIDWTEFTIPAEWSEGSIHTISYNLYGLQPASIYEVAALARNRFGWSDNSKIIRFATGGDVELPNYSTESDPLYSEEDDRDLYSELSGNEIDESSSTQSGRRNTDYDYAKFSSASSLSKPFILFVINTIFKILFV
uniref:Ig-like domain-containing protein n=1 Tax=Megaselia scalaris TaxID=36166 RepID=T1GNL9_MEGSC